MVPGHSQVWRCTTRWIWLATRENSGVDLQTRSYQRCDSFSAFDKQNISLNGQPNGLETQMGLEGPDERFAVHRGHCSEYWRMPVLRFSRSRYCFYTLGQKARFK